jgi:hypothetical protein
VSRMAMTMPSILFSFLTALSDKTIN